MLLRDHNLTSAFAKRFLCSNISFWGNILFQLTVLISILGLLFNELKLSISYSYLKGRQERE